MTTVQRLKEVDIVAAETLRKQLKLLQTICLRERFLRNCLEGLGIHHLQSLNQISWTLITEIFSNGQEISLKSGKESMKLLITEM